MSPLLLHPPEVSLPEQLVSPSLNRTFPPPGPDWEEPAPRRARRHRHDGWIPERQTRFMEELADCGVVADACKRVGLSAQSAYAFRNRRSGRAFGIAWDAVLVHRARGRLSDEVLSRSINGCIEAIHQNGEIVGERHRFDNRLFMAVLTRLDRLAEREGHREEQLRAVAEDLDDLLDCIEEGGDADAFVDARRLRPDPEPNPEPGPAGAAAEENGTFATMDDETVWAEPDGRLWTSFPPPAGFDGEEQGVFDGVSYYARTLDPREQAAFRAKSPDLRTVARLSRDRFFGFAGGEGSSASAAGPAPSQPSTSSTYRPGGGENHG